MTAPMSDPTALVAEWTDAMEDVPDGEIERAFIVDGYGEAIQGEAVLYLPDDNEAEFRGAHAEVISAWFERCSPAGIAPLLALIAQQAATIEAVSSDETFAADSVIDNTAAEIAGLVGPNDEAQAVEAAVKRALIFMRSLANLRLQRAAAALTAVEAERDRAWEAGMREAARVAEQRLEDDPGYCVYADGHDIAAEIRAAIRARAALSTAKEEKNNA